MIESDISRYFDAQVKLHGGFQRKMCWEGRRNGPDKFVKFKKRPIVLVELKKPGATPRIGQEREIARLTALGVDVRVIDSKAAIDSFIREMTE